MTVTNRVPELRWRELIAEVQGRRVELRDTFLQNFPVDRKYGQNAVAPRDVQEVVDDSIEMFLLLLAGLPLPARLESFPERLGKRRARQGVPETLLLEGVRTNFSVLWEAFRHAAADGESALLVEQVGPLMGLLEQHVSRVQRAYLLESQQLDQTSQRATNHSLARFFGGDHLNIGELDDLAAALGIQRCGELWVALLAPSTLPVDQMLEQWRVNFLWQGAVVLLGSDMSPPKLPAEARAAITRHPVPLLAIPALVRGMTHLVSSSEHSGVAFMDDLILNTAHSNMLEHLGDPAAVLGSRFFDIRQGERSRLIETLRAFTETGTVGGTSRRLFCHRNTVVTRMKRVQELTGYDPLIPKQLAVLAILLGLW